MESLTIKLYLKDYCIETAAKKKLIYLTDQYFNTKNDSNTLLKKIELLQAFIEKNDFPKLRSDDERLSETKEVFVRISKDSDNIVLDFE